MPPAEPNNNPPENLTPAPPVPQASAPADPLHPEIVQQAQPAPSTVVAPIVDGESNAPASANPSPTKRRMTMSVKSLIIAAAIVVVVGGGSALAYVGVVVPNRPENVLKSAIEHSLQSKGGTFSGTVDGAPTAAGKGVAYKATFTGGVNSTAKTADFTINPTISGVTFPVELRLVSQNAYFKVGDLSNVASLFDSFSPGAGALAKQFSTQVSNKWFVVDSTLLKEGGASCFLDADWTFSKADQQVLENAYSKQPFTTITSTSSDTVNGKKVEKLQLSIDDDKAAAYAKSIDGQLSFLKHLQGCSKTADQVSSTSGNLADHDKTPLTLWVDKSTHQIVRFAGGSTAADAKKSDLTLNLTVDVKPDVPNITAPTGAEPVTNLLSTLKSGLDLNSLNQ